MPELTREYKYGFGFSVEAHSVDDGIFKPSVFLFRNEGTVTRTKRIAFSACFEREEDAVSFARHAAMQIIECLSTDISLDDIKFPPWEPPQ